MEIAPTAIIFPWAKIIHDGTNFSLGEFSQVDDFVFLSAGRSCRLGSFVHICSFVSIIGGGEFEMWDFSGLSAGCRIITGSDDFTGPYLHNPNIPEEFKNTSTSRVKIGTHAIVGTNTIVFPGVEIGEGVAVGAGCFVRSDLKPWGIYTGSPLRKVGERDREAILAKENVLRQKLASAEK